MTSRKPSHYFAASLVMVLFAVLPFRLNLERFTELDVAAVIIFGALAVFMLIRGVRRWRHARVSDT